MGEHCVVYRGFYHKGNWVVIKETARSVDWCQIEGEGVILTDEGERKTIQLPLCCQHLSEIPLQAGKVQRNDHLKGN